MSESSDGVGMNNLDEEKCKKRANGLFLNNVDLSVFIT